MGNKTYRAFLALCYIGVYHLLYVNYINPGFDYAHYSYNHRAPILHIAAYILAVAPIFASTHKRTPGSYGAALLYVFCYAPGQLTITFMWSQSDASLLALQTTLAASMGFLFLAGRYKFTFRNLEPQEQTSIELSKRTEALIFAMTVASTMALLIGNWSHMRLVGFDEVYELRFQARDAEINAVSSYLVLWITTCFIPYYAASGTLKRSIPRLLTAAALGFLTYTANGAKIALLMPYAIAAIVLVYSAKGSFLTRLLVITTLTLVALIFFSGPLSDIIKSLIVMRTLSIGGWAITTYYDYFVSNGLTFYSHIRPLEALLGIYQYGQNSLGQVIGLHYSGSTDANFNANFWASDGIAALGTAGIIPVTGVLGFIIVVINSATKYCNNRLLTVWLTGFWVALLNSPLTISIVSGGGLLILLLVWHSGRQKSKQAKFRPSNDALLAN